jgi:isocitrate dehydrogenase
MTSFNGVPVPADGQRIEYSDGKYRVPDRPIIPFIEGDGTGRDIWKASVRVFDAAVEKAYYGKRGVAWYEVFPTTPSMPSASSALPSKDRSPRPSAAASARSTSPCASCSISTPVSVP